MIIKLKLPFGPRKSGIPQDVLIPAPALKKFKILNSILYLILRYFYTL